MGWGTTLNCNIYYNRKTYNDIDEVERDLEDLNKCIFTCKQELRDLAIMTEPSKYYNPEEYNNSYDFINQTVINDLELLDEYIVERDHLQILILNWDKCHKDGLGIAPIDGIHWDSAFISGDFIKTDKNPDGKD